MMLLIYHFTVHSFAVSGFFALWQSLYMFFVVFFASKSKIVNGYFARKPDIVEIHIIYRCNTLYMVNCLRYLFGLERPPMPWYAKINTVFCALGMIGIAWMFIIVVLDDCLHWIDFSALIKITSENPLF